MQWVVIFVLALLAVMVLGFILHLIKWLLIIAVVVAAIAAVTRALPGGRAEP